MRNRDIEPLIGLLNNQNIQYFPGILQRDFDWILTQYEEFFETVMESSEQQPRFVNGVITNLFKTEGSMRYVSLTDGQQRMVMLSLGICATCAFAKNNNIPKEEFNYQYVLEDYLINPRQQGNAKYKLLLRKKDRNTFKMLVDELPLPLNRKSELSNGEKVSPKIITAYNYLYGNLNLNNYLEFYKKLHYLISLEFIVEPHDDESIIFSSINGTGKEVSTFDKCRAYVLGNYSMEEGEHYEEKYWESLSENMNLRETILRGFIIHKTNFTPINTYFEFKKIFDNCGNIEDFQKEIYEFNKLYLEVVNAKSDDEELNFIFEGLTLIYMKSQFTPIVRIYKFYNDGEITYDCLLNSLKLLLNVGLRMRLERSDVNALRDILEYSIKWCVPENLYNSLYAQLKPYFISDTKFEMIIETTNFYRGKGEEFALINKRIPGNINKITDYLLISIENNHHGAGRINPKHYSKEHICPQTLNEYWGHFFNEEDHREYVHSLGNITLLAKSYNSSNGNNSFEDKKNNPKGFKDDKLYLNQSIIGYTSWTVDSIRQRTEILAKELCKIFNIPDTVLVNTPNQTVLMGGK